VFCHSMDRLARNLDDMVTLGNASFFRVGLDSVRFDASAVQLYRARAQVEERFDSRHSTRKHKVNVILVLGLWLYRRAQSNGSLGIQIGVKTGLVRFFLGLANRISHGRGSQLKKIGSG
jgi:hypothetical protein